MEWFRENRRENVCMGLWRDGKGDKGVWRTGKRKGKGGKGGGGGGTRRGRFLIGDRSELTTGGGGWGLSLKSKRGAEEGPSMGGFRTKGWICGVDVCEKKSQLS